MFLTSTFWRIRFWVVSLQVYLLFKTYRKIYSTCLWLWRYLYKGGGRAWWLLLVQVCKVGTLCGGCRHTKYQGARHQINRRRSTHKIFIQKRRLQKVPIRRSITWHQALLFTPPDRRWSLGHHYSHVLTAWQAHNPAKQIGYPKPSS